MQVPEIKFMLVEELKTQVTNYAEQKDSVGVGVVSEEEFDLLFDALFEN